jgi:hypothetical protein
MAESPYVEFPTPDNSRTLGLPIVPADRMTSLERLIVWVWLLRIYSTPVAVSFEFWSPVEFAHKMRETVALRMTTRFGRFAKGV